MGCANQHSGGRVRSLVVLLVLLASDNAGDSGGLQLGFSDLCSRFDHRDVVFHLHGKEDLRWPCDGGRRKEREFPMIRKPETPYRVSRCSYQTRSGKVALSPSGWTTLLADARTNVVVLLHCSVATLKIPSPADRYIQTRNLSKYLTNQSTACISAFLPASASATFLLSEPWANP